jgi:hypothetical protein
MLYTASVSALKKQKTKMSVYYLEEKYGNGVVAPDQKDLELYRDKILTRKGLILNYLAKLMGSAAEEWMRHVSEEAASKDVVIVDHEKNAEDSFRKFLAEMMVSMFSSCLKFCYAGELTEDSKSR